MWPVIPRLYLGDDLDARDRSVLTDCGITHIVNCACEIPSYFPGEFEYLRLELHDPDPAFIDYIPELCAFIDQGRAEGAVMVHCRMGMSRSPASILAYLLHRGKTYAQALRRLSRAVREDDGFAEPHEVFLEQLRDYFDEAMDEDS